MSLNPESLRTAVTAVKSDINLYDCNDIKTSVSHIIKNIGESLEEIEKSFEVCRKAFQYNSEIMANRIAILTVIDDIAEQMVERINNKNGS